MTKLPILLVAVLLIAGTTSSMQTCGGDPLCIVQAERAKYATPLAGQQLALLRAIAARLNAEQGRQDFGVLVKTGGNNCDGYACDIICAGQGAAQAQYDVLAEEEGAARPTWSRPSQIAVRVCEPVPAGSPPLPPAPTCEVCEAERRQLRSTNAQLLEDLEASRRQVSAAEEAVDRERAGRLVAEERVKQLEAQPPARCVATGPGWVRSLFKISCRVEQ